LQWGKWGIKKQQAISLKHNTAKHYSVSFVKITSPKGKNAVSGIFIPT